MDETPKPEQDPKDKKSGKKLELNKETVQELSEQDLDQVAGGLLGKTIDPCRSVQLDCPPGRDPTVTCPPPTPTVNGASCICPITE